MNTGMTRGRVNGLRARYFATPFSGAVTVGLGLVAALIVASFGRWALWDAVFAPNQRAACLVEGAGACWSVIATRWRLILFGLYPFGEQWRSAIACGGLIATGALSCVPYFWPMPRLPLLWIGGFGLFFGLMRGGFFGLAPVSVQDWGGLSLTLLVFAAVSLIGMPLAIVFALLRRSELPVIAFTMGKIIDTIRSLPLLVILFLFAIVLPFGLPDWAVGDKLTRVIVGYALFFACYQAEILRGGMQAIAPGQEEAAKALGMRYWHRICHIVLPQAFRNALPPTIGQFVVTLKETTLVVVIGFFDVMASGNAAFGTADWSFAQIEVYAFLAFVFFVFTFSLSRYGALLERRLRVHSR